MVENRNVNIMTSSNVIFFIEFTNSGFRRTQCIPELGLFYNMWGFYLEVFLGGYKMVT